MRYRLIERVYGHHRRHLTDLLTQESRDPSIAPYSLGVVVNTLLRHPGFVTKDYNRHRHFVPTVGVGFCKSKIREDENHRRHDVTVRLLHRVGSLPSSLSVERVLDLVSQARWLTPYQR